MEINPKRQARGVKIDIFFRRNCKLRRKIVCIMTFCTTSYTSVLLPFNPIFGVLASMDLFVQYGEPVESVPFLLVPEKREAHFR